jgi:Protein of unknown function (DUF3305)
MDRPSIQVAVVLERVAEPNRWEAWSFRVAEVLADEGAFGSEPRRLHDDGRISRWLHPGFAVELFADECKGYFLNLTSGAPVWFVMWQRDEADPSQARPGGVSLSYIMSDRWLSCDERVDTLPLPAELQEWLRVFTNENFKVDAPQRQRAQSFLSPEERDRRARALKHDG